MLRLAAALSLLVGAAALGAYLEIMGRGPLASPEARHLRAMKERRHAPATTHAVSLDDVVALPHRLPLARYAAIESDGATCEGYIQRIHRAADDDYHLELTPTPRRSRGPDTTYVTAEITPGLRFGSSRWSYGGLTAAFRPNSGGVTAWDRGPRRVRVSGWLLYDFQYDAPLREWSPGVPAPRASGWEIHPVTRIELWDESLGRYVDLTR